MVFLTVNAQEMAGGTASPYDRNRIPGHALRPTFPRRLWLLWGMAATIVLTIPFSIAQLIGHKMTPTAGTFKRWAGRWSRSILGCIGVRVRVKSYTDLDASRPYIFVANHQNALDILILGGHLPSPFGFVAKAELAQMPFLGLAIRNSSSVFVDRSDARKALSSMKAAGERIRSGNSVLLFAEGSRSHGPEMLPFKKGAFMIAVEAGVPIVPVVIQNSYRVMTHSGRALRPGSVDLTICEPIAIEGKTRRDIPELMDSVRRRMERELENEMAVE